MAIGEMILHLEIEAGKNKVAMADIINNKMIRGKPSKLIILKILAK